MFLDFRHGLLALTMYGHPRNRKHGTSEASSPCPWCLVSRWLLKRSSYCGSVGRISVLATNNNALYTFSFLMLLYFAVFSVVSARERHWFWATLPSKTFLSALVADAITGTVLTFVGLPGLMPLPWWQTLAIFVYAMVSCLVLNDAVKVAMIKWRVLNAVATKPVDVTPQIAKRAYELYEKRGRQDGRAVQDWEQAEREVRKDEPHK